MASISTDPNGRKRILFVDGNGKRHTIRLGPVQQRHAEGIRTKIESLLSAAQSRQPLDRETATWLADIPEQLHARLAAARLIKPRQSRTLGDWLKSFMTSRASLKPESRRKLEQTGSKLEKHFGADKPLHEITPEDAAAWREKLLKQGLSEAATKIHTGNVKTIMAEAVRRELIARSPFANLKGGVTATQNDRYVTRDEIERVLAAAPDTEWRLLLGLARLAGLRTPSEVTPLTWDDVDWERSRLRVHSPKTERFPGHELRWVPITPRLMELLQDRFDATPEGETRLITISSIDGRRRKVRRFMDDAKVEPWDDTWQTLRRSCEIEWAQHYPQYAVSRWIGHSITVSGRHYVNAIPDELFDRAAGREATQIPTQQAAESTRNDSHRPENDSEADSPKSSTDKDLRTGATRCDKSSKWSRGESNPRAGAVRWTPLRV